MSGLTPAGGLQALRLMLERKRAKVRLQEERMVRLTDYWWRTEPKLRAALDLVNAVLAENSGMRVDWATDYAGSDEIPVNWSKADPKASLGLIQYDRDRWHFLCWCQLKDVASGQEGTRGIMLGYLKT